mmetsp:Transcript_19122/g.51443  ORF Transcript_19122/g.51443 Transcript_19122/m.51443 type:complete len:202 (+) Transcript_19122:624-1229(+)
MTSRRPWTLSRHLPSCAWRAFHSRAPNVRCMQRCTRTVLESSSMRASMMPREMALSTSSSTSSTATPVAAATSAKASVPSGAACAASTRARCRIFAAAWSMSTPMACSAAVCPARSSGLPEMKTCSALTAASSLPSCCTAARSRRWSNWYTVGLRMADAMAVFACSACALTTAVSAESHSSSSVSSHACACTSAHSSAAAA